VLVLLAAASLFCSRVSHGERCTSDQTFGASLNRYIADFGFGDSPGIGNLILFLSSVGLTSVYYDYCF